MTHLRPALVSLLFFTLLTGAVDPAVVTLIAQAVFPSQANGSLIERDGKVIGSRLIGQPFEDPKYFWGRPSATSPFPYNAGASAGSNQGPTNPALIKAAQARVDALRAADPGNTTPVPVDLVTASAAGSIRTSVRRQRSIRRVAWQERAASTRRRSGSSWSSTPSGVSSASSVSHA
jgi:K+-transporting ATPase ATPase C chain